MSEFAQVQAELTARGYSRMVFDLSRIAEVLDLLGSPQRTYPSIHIAGTNGKTTTARIVDSLLRAHGLRSGCFTSPALADVRDQISLNGSPLSEERFVEVYREIAPVVRLWEEREGNEPLTPFELTTAMAMAAFADAPVDVAVVEAGLGGTDDATNVLRAGTAVLTPVGLDHMEWLGDTIEDIADAKAGIVHDGATVICAQQPAEAMPPIVRRCLETGATLAVQGRDIDLRQRILAVGGQVLTIRGLGGLYEDLFIPLHGYHQAQNATVGLAAVEAFLGIWDGSRRLDLDVVRAGLADARSPGRMERVGTAPTILLDVAHNVPAMAAVVTTLREEFVFSRLIGVVAILSDKDAAGLIELLDPVVDLLICTRNSSPRTRSADELGDIAVGILGHERVRVEPSVAKALTLARAEAAADEGGGVLVTGSVATVGDARPRLFTSG